MVLLKFAEKEVNKKIKKNLPEGSRKPPPLGGG